MRARAAGRGRSGGGATSAAQAGRRGRGAGTRAALVGDIARLDDGGRTGAPVAELRSRRGPYRLYGPAQAPGTHDDWRYEGPRLLVGCFHNVCSADGGLNVAAADGRYAVGECYHVLDIPDEADRAYALAMLRLVLGAAHAVGAHPLSYALPWESLARVELPWPPRQTRAAVASLAARVGELSGHAGRLSELCLRLGDAAHAARLAQSGAAGGRSAAEAGAGAQAGAGLPSAFAARPAPGRDVPAVGAQGVVGYAEEADFPGGLVLTRSGDYLCCHVEPSPARLALGAFGLRAARRGAEAPSDAPSEGELYFALRAAGVLEERLSGVSVPYKSVSDVLEAARMPLGGDAALEDCAFRLAESCRALARSHERLLRAVLRSYYEGALSERALEGLVGAGAAGRR